MTSRTREAAGPLSAVGRVLDLWLRGLRQPRQVLSALREPQSILLATLAHARLKMVDVSQVGFLSSLFPGALLNDIERVLEEVRANTGLYRHLEQSEAGRVKGRSRARAHGVSYAEGELLYAAVRIANPGLVVETGVAAGVSSTFILQALEENRGGRLYSIDLPVGGLADDGIRYWRPPGVDPGWAIPERLRGRWELTLGRSEAELLPLLERLGSIDMFFHDSLHTFQHMEFEYRTAWRHLQRGGHLLSHDVWAPYLRHCSAAGSAPIRYGKLGGVRRP